MSQDQKIKQPADRSKIDINEPGELIWWSYHLGVGPEKLLSVIKQVGNAAQVVRKSLP